MIITSNREGQTLRIQLTYSDFDHFDKFRCYNRINAQIENLNILNKIISI
jgi:hypothetical protein